MSDETPITNDDGETPGLFQTFIGAGFGTVQIERAVGTDPAPPAVSGRRYLRDNLPEHFDPAYAPRDVLDLLTEWLGLEHDEARSGEERRAIVRMAPELMRRRGTKAGLELALSLAFPGVPFRIEDAGGVTWALDPDGDWKDAPGSFVIYCDMPLSEDRQAAIARLIDQAKPAHVAYRLRVRSAEPPEGGDA